jgi:hypothetical protein
MTDMSNENTVTVKSRRGAIRHSANPFLSEAAQHTKQGTKRLSNKAGNKFMILSEHGEVLANAGFHEVVDVDKTQFVKLYINGVKAFKGLKAAGTKVFELIYLATQKSPGTDTIWLHFMEIEQAITPISRPTFDRGMSELLEKGFIAESLVPGKYFLNIDYLFNGNRLAFIKEYRIQDDNMTEKRRRAKVENLDQQQLELGGISSQEP